MKLYKLTSSNFYEKTRYIVALNKAKAITKYYEVEEIYEDSTVRVEYICDRDDMVPTIEPIKEFNYER